MPALSEICENPLLEELAMVFFSSGKKKAEKRKIPTQSKEERKKAFKDLKEKTKEWRLKNG